MGNRDTIDVEADVVISQSDAKSIMLCGQRVGLRHEPGYVDVPSEAMSFGTLGHAVIEQTIQGDDGARLAMRPAVEALWKEILLEEGHELDKLAGRQVIQNGIGEAIALRRAWVEGWLIHQDEASFAAVEDRRTMRLPHPTLKIALEGTADLVTWEPRIYDWKTAGSGWKPEREKGEDSLQAIVYAMLYADIVGDCSTPVPFEWHIWDRKKYEWDVRVIHVTEAMVASGTAALVQYAEAKHSGILPPNPYGESYGKKRRGWHCSAKYCGAWDICPYKGMVPDSVDLDEKVDPMKGWIKK